MITFYPRDIGMWRDSFDFTNEKTNKDFDTYEDFIKFMEEHRVPMNDPQFPFRIGKKPWDVFKGKHGEEVYVVHQWTVKGWISGHE